MLWIAGCIFGCMCLGSLFGLVLGVIIGKFAPGYYRAVFSGGSLRNFDPVSVGIGLGLSEGAAAGAVIGFVSVLIFLWYRKR